MHGQRLGEAIQRLPFEARGNDDVGPDDARFELRLLRLGPSQRRLEAIEEGLQRLRQPFGRRAIGGVEGRRQPGSVRGEVDPERLDRVERGDLIGEKASISDGGVREHRPRGVDLAGHDRVEASVRPAERWLAAR
jgi:hypothetical protein